MQTSKKAFLLVVVVASIGLIFLGAKLNQQNGWINSFVALGETHEDGEFYITPSEANIDQGESVTFNSYTQSSTESVPTNVTWTVEEADEDDDSDDGAALPVAYASIPEETAMWLDAHSDTIMNILVVGGTGAVSEEDVSAIEAELSKKPNPVTMTGCDNSAECKVTIGNSPGKFLVTAEAGGNTATADVTVSDKLTQINFQDPIPEWVEEAAAMLAANNIMRGYDNGDFGATDEVSRGQLTLLLYRIMTEHEGIDAAGLMVGKKCDNLYSDVPFGHYAYDAICFGTYYHWFSVGPDAIKGNVFEPEEVLSRREVAQILYNVVVEDMYKIIPMNVMDKDDILKIADAFTDVERTDPSAEAIGTLYFFGIMNGTQVGNAVYLYPDRTLNRGETAAILWRLIQKM